MKGLEIARQYFNEWGLPYLRSEFPHISERAAALLCGKSQSLGNDDETSRDHEWGPGFELVLTGDDMRRFGRKLRSAIQRDAPDTWNGFRWRSPNVYSVESINKWFSGQIGCPHPPATGKGWLDKTREDNLYMVRHATVFHDPLGEFSARREAFTFYPESAWVRRLQRETFNVWHYGQYNFPRIAGRKDAVNDTVCLANFIHATMKLCLLLAKDYAPYWKWVAAEFRKKPDTGDIDAALTEVVATRSKKKQLQLVESICDTLCGKLLTTGLIEGKRTGHRHSLFDANKELVALANELDQCDA